MTSHVLVLFLCQRRSDWSHRWSMASLLVETFVDTHTQEGTSYHASGWTHIGITAAEDKDIDVFKLTLTAWAA